MRDAAVNLRALAGQRDLIDRAAQILGKNRSDFMLFFNLDAEKLLSFTEILDAPVGPNPGLERLMAVQAPWSSAKA